MNILNSTFDGDYGSDLENELEAAIKEHDKEMIQLKAAINRWNNARFLLIYACNQIQCAEQHWKEIHELDIELVLTHIKYINKLLFKRLNFSIIFPKEILRLYSALLNLLITFSSAMKIWKRPKRCYPM